ncbi:putative porin [Pseudomonas sp. LY-1]|uniref:putative porin n=1 Tax=Pseudomonas TaxID=286 RepID=UPI00209DADED|nr:MULTISPECIES: putative porin [Pseudomonas]MCP1508130.1 putative membrane protein [Pseudomonas marginalis]MCP1525634.1 putative membrane protein [Pseudomonas marginalis]MDQ0499052.1 putative membrane protein [Pseudomonas marginalis]
MRLASTKTAAALCGGLLLALSVPASAAVDAKLLDMLKANGQITGSQYTELQAELAKDQKEKQIAQQAQQETNEQIAATAKKTNDLSVFDQKLAWAAKTQFKGDVRFRQETVKIQGESNNGGRDKDRQRIRARLGAYTEINNQVDTGIRISTGSSDDARSTNQDQDNYFDKKSIWLDLGYIDYHPDQIKNLHVIGGKMLQPWVSMGDVIWDGDINPEGLALTYKYPLGSSAELFGSLGNYNLKDNVDGDGVQFRNDLRLTSGQLGTRFSVTDNLKMTLGGSIYAYQNDENSTCTSSTTPCALAVNGNSANEEFRLYEGFAQADIGGLAVPLAFYGQYVKNNDASNDQDTAWLLGAKSKVFGFNLDYNYRDTQRNAVVGAFTDSDFANGTTGSRGHKMKVSYDIDKNFAVGATYYLTKADYASRTQRDANTNTLQLDAEAKF